MIPENSRCTLYGLYMLLLLLMMLNFHFIAVASHPLGKAAGTKFKRSNYRQGYNEFSNYRSLNQSSPEILSTLSSLSNQWSTTRNLDNNDWKTIPPNTNEHHNHYSNLQPSGLPISSYTGLQHGESTFRSFSEDSSPSDLTTLPQIEVVSKTIDSDSTVAVVERDINVSLETTEKPQTATATPEKEDSTEPGALEEGDGIKEEHPVEIDIFDNLMSSIHTHWLDFVSKMKLSVVDVWKSMSNHMMDKLENFAVSM